MIVMDDATAKIRRRSDYGDNLLHKMIFGIYCPTPRGVYCFCIPHLPMEGASLRLRCGSDAWYEGSVVIINSLIPPSWTKHLLCQHS